MSLADIGDPVAHGFINRLLQRGLAGGHRDDLRAKKAHARDIERLPFHIDRAHIDDALQTGASGHRSRGDAVLARAGLGDDAGLAHALSEEDLAERIIDLVRAGVQQVFAFEVDLRAAELAGQPLGKIKWRGAAGIMVQQRGELRLEAGVFAQAQVLRREIVQRSHERFRHKHAAVRTEVAVLIRKRLKVDHKGGAG